MKDFIKLEKMKMTDTANILSASNKTLYIKDSAEEYCLCEYMEKKADKPEIIWCQYVPQLLSDEEYAKKFLANKTYAFVKYEYPDDKYANQKGEVLDEYDTDDGEKYYLLKINVAQKAKGYISLVAFEPEYEEVWFSETDIQRFLKYDENGKPL